MIGREVRRNRLEGIDSLKTSRVPNQFLQIGQHPLASSLAGPHLAQESERGTSHLRQFHRTNEEEKTNANTKK